jgi:hypothetical protein
VKKLLALLFSLWTGAATAGVPCSLPFNLQNNTIADATQVMANYNAIVTCLGNAAASGANSDITGLFGLTSPLGPTFGGANTFYGGSSVGTNSLTVTVLPNTFTLTTGFMVSFTVGATNTGAATLTVNGGATVNLLRATPAGPIAMTGGELTVGNRALVGYDGTQWQLLTQTVQAGGFSNYTTLASAATTDLGTIPGHLIQITGTTTITSFGSSASTAYPIYRVIFNNALTLTASGNLLLVGGNANIVTQANDSADALYLGSGIWYVFQYTRASGLPLVPLTTPTVQRFTTGSGTYTPTAGTVRIKVRMVGGGGGGGGTQGGGTGGTGGTTTFASWTALGGTGGVSNAQGGVGGSGGVNGTGVLVYRVQGGGGQGTNPVSTAQGSSGGAGGNSIFGGGAPGTAFGSVGATGATGTGGGGSGGSGSAGSTDPGAGGGGGEGVEFYVAAPTAVSYAVGGGGTAGTAGGTAPFAGGGGGSGQIVIEEFYQ